MSAVARSRPQCYSPRDSVRSTATTSAPNKPWRHSLVTTACSLFCPNTWSKWTYLSCTIPDIAPMLRPLDETISSVVIPALTGRPPPGNQERSLFALPARLGGLGLHVPSNAAADEYHSSRLVTSTLCNHIVSQNLVYSPEIIAMQLDAKKHVSCEARERTLSEFNEIYVNMTTSLQRAIDLTREKGSSTWLTVLPLTEHGFALHKGAFYDALALRYGWPPPEMPTMCACGSSFSVDHAMSWWISIY